MVTQCLLVCEGSSDAPLVSHIQRLLDSYGYHSSGFVVSTRGRGLVDKVRNGLDIAPHCELLFVHRDADRAGAEARYQEITEAIQMAGYAGPWVGVVPVRMTETWLLLDEPAIRVAVRKPGGRASLNLPTPSEAERIANPKETLSTALLDASESGRRRRNKLRSDIPEIRSRLLQNLPIGGLLEQVPSWTRFRNDTVAALHWGTYS